MKLEHPGEQLIKDAESLELEAYPDPGSELGNACKQLRLPMRDYRKVPHWPSLSGSPWTIGWGHTGPEIRPGDVITAIRAEALFAQDVEPVELAVTRLCAAVVNQNQFDACCSFAYNAGIGAFTGSTLLKYLLLHKFAMASGEFLKWNKSGNVVLLGLVKRRRAERALFDTPWSGHTAP